MTKELVARACVHAMYGHGEPTPAESTWTHALIKLRTTLLRVVLDRVGIDSFSEVGDDDGGVGGDVVGAENSPHALQRVRATKTLHYYNGASHFEELAVLAIALGSFDENLLFPFLWATRRSTRKKRTFQACP